MATHQVDIITTCYHKKATTLSAVTRKNKDKLTRKCEYSRRSTQDESNHLECKTVQNKIAIDILH